MTRQVIVLAGRGRMEINVDPFFHKSTLADIRKLFKIVFLESWRNEECIQALNAYLRIEVDAARNELGQAIERETISRKSAEGRERKRFSKTIKRCEKEYDRRMKILRYFEAEAARDGRILTR